MAPLPLGEIWIMESIGSCQRLTLTRRRVGRKRQKHSNLMSYVPNMPLACAAVLQDELRPTFACIGIRSHTCIPGTLEHFSAVYRILFSREPWASATRSPTARG